MGSWAEELQKRIKETKASLDEAHQERKKWTQKVEALTVELDALETVQRAEMERSGVKPEVETVTEVPHSNGAMPASKSARILNVVRLAGSKGVAPIDVIRTLQATDEKIEDNYVYAILSRKKQDGVLEQIDGKYRTK